MRQGLRSRLIYSNVMVTATAAAVGIALLFAFPAFAAARHGPDLKIKNLTFKPSPPRAIVEHNGTAEFKLSFKLVNVGDRRAGRSRIAAHIDRLGEVAGQGAGALGPGGSRATRFDRPGYPLSSSESSSSGLGFRKVWVCADAEPDVKETNERNNCSPKVTFRAVPRTWLVQFFTHSSKSDDATPTSYENVDTSAKQGMKFDFEAVVRDASTGARSLVWLASGGAEETRSGYGGATGEPGVCEDGAAYTGHGDVTHDPWDYLADPEGYLEVSWDLRDYFSNIVDSNYTYEVTGPCVDAADAYMDELRTWNTDNEFAPQEKVQAGSYAFDDTINTFTDVWSFEADVPGG